MVVRERENGYWKDEIGERQVGEIPQGRPCPS